jgi:hypothetical protein
MITDCRVNYRGIASLANATICINEMELGQKRPIPRPHASLSFRWLFCVEDKTDSKNL